jgi:enoyl-[acyl-carrier-protein] reductase (NADH)
VSHVFVGQVLSYPNLLCVNVVEYSQVSRVRVLFASGYTTAMTGEVVHVDSGLHIAY